MLATQIHQHEKTSFNNLLILWGSPETNVSVAIFGSRIQVSSFVSLAASEQIVGKNLIGTKKENKNPIIQKSGSRTKGYSVKAPQSAQ